MKTSLRETLLAIAGKSSEDTEVIIVGHKDLTSEEESLPQIILVDDLLVKLESLRIPQKSIVKTDPGNVIAAGMYNRAIDDAMVMVDLAFDYPGKITPTYEDAEEVHDNRVLQHG